MKAALLSDVHIDRPDDLASRRFCAFVDALEAERLFILGDLFHAGWGYPGPADSGHEPALLAMERLLGRGTELVFVPGNHDFAMADYLGRRMGLSVTSCWEGELAGRRAVLIHGDEADQSPGYRLMSWALRGPVFGGLMRGLGPTRGRRLIRRMAGSSRVYGDKTAPSWLREAQLALADARLAGGADLVVMGHSHHGEVCERAEGVFVNTGDFGHAGTWLCVTDTLELRRWAV